MTSEESKKTIIEVSNEQAAHLANALALLKALAAPPRLNIIGVLAGRNGQQVSMEELAELCQKPAATLERDLRQLAEIGIIQILEWSEAKPGREPTPALICFNSEYLKTIPQIIGTLHKITIAISPAQEKPKLDERTQTLERFMKNGRLLGLPVQIKRQMYIYEEVANRFEPGRTYPEREVDAILKDIYEYDYVTLRRSLIDFHYLTRAAGIYQRV
jgi:Fe2+ or Zn2+ uptake regulation protein